jgi:hypothetical protein
VQGTYTLRSEDGGEFGTATGRETFLYGFSKFFRRRGAEPGEHLVLVVDLQSKTITARIGDAGLVESYERGEISPEWRSDLDASLNPEPGPGAPAPFESGLNEGQAIPECGKDVEEIVENRTAVDWIRQRIGGILRGPTRRAAKGRYLGASPPRRWRAFRQR